MSRRKRSHRRSSGCAWLVDRVRPGAFSSHAAKTAFDCDQNAPAAKWQPDAARAIPRSPGYRPDAATSPEGGFSRPSGLPSGASHRLGQPAPQRERRRMSFAPQEVAAQQVASTCLDETGRAIVRELYHAVSSITDEPALLILISSWADGVDDEDILEGLRCLHETG